MIKVRSQCEYLKHLPAYLGDTMEKQLAQGDKDMEILIRQWQPKEMKDRNWPSANYFLVEDPEGGARPQTKL